MRAPVSWIKDYVDIKLSPEELAYKLTMAGLEVSGIDVIGGSWENVYVGKITNITPHPSADRLRLATVDLGNESITVVCGAPNIDEGQKIAFAKVGANLLNARSGKIEVLKAAIIRGVESAGMICSERELSVGENHDGILVLHQDAPMGTSLSQYLGDVVLEIDVTPNRPDCLSIVGIAREIAALTGEKIRFQDITYDEGGGPIENLAQVHIEDSFLCPRYTASVIQGISVGPSPDWMQDRLIKAGQRPINNVVDVTNYVLLEYGQPMHAFDHDTLDGGTIVVRPAVVSEEFTTLDGSVHILNPPMLVISDATRSVALAGIMGGLNTEMTGSTTTVMLESASFEATNTRRTSQKLRIRTEASSRFEKSLSAELPLLALKRATQLVCQIAGGRVCKGILDVYPGQKDSMKLTFTLARLKKVLGMYLPVERVQDIFRLLGFEFVSANEDTMLVTVPYWRSDINQEDDLIEEIARIIGYDEIPVTTLSTAVPFHQPQPSIELREKIKDIMVACGMQETISYSLTNQDVLARARFSESTIDPLRVANPMSSELEYLRTTLRGSMLGTTSFNQRHSQDGLRLFEIGKIYQPRHGSLPTEIDMLTGILAGPRSPESWFESSGNVGFFDVKGIIETLLGQLHVPCAFEPADDSLFLPGKCAFVTSGGHKLGVVGEVDVRVLRDFNIDINPVGMFDLDLTRILSVTPSGLLQFNSLARYPGAFRDLAIILDRSISAGRVQDIIESHLLVDSARLFDVYEGDAVSDSQKSLAYRILFQVKDRTLDGDEVNEACSAIMTLMEDKLGATLRE